MYADDHGRQTTPRLSVGRLPRPAVASAEGRCRQAKARLSAAQQESLEAGIEFLAARAALHDWLEEIWPGQEDEGPEADSARCPASRTSR